MTAVFKVSTSGALQEYQVGVVDLVATASAATSLWGWVGGLRGIQNVFRSIRGGTEDWSAVYSLSKTLPIACRMLTFHGIATFQDDATETFGGDSILQMVGVTLCALGHELRREIVIELFMTCLAPARFRPTFEGVDGAKEVFQTQLLDNYNVILNEGASRGLPTRFNQAASSLCLESLENRTGVATEESESDTKMVGGLLRWVSSQSREPYFTRSALVVRVAAYLREVGYLIDKITTWIGHGPRPMQPRAVILTLGGFSKTDTHMFDIPSLRAFPKTTIISHYRYDTVGSMLLNTLQYTAALRPEPLQDYFDSIQDDIASRLAFKWEVKQSIEEEDRIPVNQIVVKARHRTGLSFGGSIAMRLSCFYFAQCADFIAPCYERIATPDTLDVIKKQLNLKLQRQHNGVDQRLIEFRAITACIIIAVIGRLGGRNFSSLRHSTILSIQTPGMIKTLAREVEILLTDGLTFESAAAALAFIHASHNLPVGDENLDHESHLVLDYKTIGYRNGSYAVLPALLSRMAEGPSELALGFECFDEFIANIPVQSDGKVVSGCQSAISQFHRDHATLEAVLAEATTTERDTAHLESAIPKASLGTPIPLPADVPLYLNIERSLDHDTPVLSLCGRVHGTSIGHVGVYTVLSRLISSLQGQTTRTHESSIQRYGNRMHGTSEMQGSYCHFPQSRCLIVPASVWCRAEPKPCGKPNLSVYIPVQGDAAWALFLIGEIASCICLGCVSCTETWVRENDDLPEEKGFVIVGY